MGPDPPACAWTEHPLCGWGLCDSTQFLLCFFLGVATHNMSFVRSPTFSPSVFSASQTPPAQCLTLPSIGIAPPLHTTALFLLPRAHFPVFTYSEPHLPALCALSPLSSPLQPLDELFILTASHPASTQTLHLFIPPYSPPRSTPQLRTPLERTHFSLLPKGTPRHPPGGRPVRGPGAPPGPAGPAPSRLAESGGRNWAGGGAGRSQAGAAVAGSERGAQLGQRLVALGLQGLGREGRRGVGSRPGPTMSAKKRGRTRPGARKLRGWPRGVWAGLGGSGARASPERGGGLRRIPSR